MTERWRPNKSVTFNRWRDCDRCGLPWPEKVFKKQYGLTLCPECIDEPGNKDFQERGQGIDSDVKPPWEPEETE